MRWDGPTRRGPGRLRRGPDLSEAFAGLVWRVGCSGRVHASLLVPYCTLASCGGGAHYWARRDERLTRRVHRCASRSPSSLPRRPSAGNQAPQTRRPPGGQAAPHAHAKRYRSAR